MELFGTKIIKAENAVKISTSDATSWVVKPSDDTVIMDDLWSEEIASDLREGLVYARSVDDAFYGLKITKEAVEEGYYNEGDMDDYYME